MPQQSRPAKRPMTGYLNASPSPVTAARSAALPSYFRNCSKAAFACFGARLGTSGEAVNAAIGTSLPHCTRQTGCEARRTAVLRAFPQVPARRRHNRVSERDLCRCANWVRHPLLGALRTRVVLFCSPCTTWARPCAAQTTSGPDYERPENEQPENEQPENELRENRWREKEHAATARLPAQGLASIANPILQIAGGKLRGARHRASPPRSAGP